MPFDQAMLPAETMNTRDAAEVILRLWHLHEARHPFDEWIKDVERHHPDLAAMMFTVSRDE